VISSTLLGVVRCPDCRGTLSDAENALVCTACGHLAAKRPGYLDLRPSATFTEQTKYLDEALHGDARHETVSPPLLQAGVRQRMLRRMLAPAPGDLVIDLGCGSGRSIVWNRPSGAAIVGIDVAPYFAREALDRGDLVLGDLRRLPFADASFSKGYALDVFEHLSRETLGEVLNEIARVIRPGGRVFVYSHVRKNSWLAGGLRAINRLARGLERLGLVDLRQERLRKSDHVNPLADVPDLERTIRAAGFRVVQIRYYTPLLGAFVENILMRVTERGLGWWRGRRKGTPTAADAGPDADAVAVQRVEEARLARTAAKERLAAGGVLYRAIQLVTGVMMIDVWLFGRVRTGPFFVLLERASDTPGPPVSEGRGA
jgi:ubiquinone/menaquinone biosynthesis C-methylase UbiE